ncbi:MAG: ABC-2 type transport system ATP-binding protein [Mariniblastus sp.]|jgi:ABC-2 type transport system ATP-binding protein
MSKTIVETHSLTKRFGKFTALSECSLDIPAGEVFGLLGPNGAGKSTLIRLLLGFLNPTSGSAKIGGSDCQTQRVDVHRQVSYLPGDARLFRMMRGRKTLKLFCGFREDASFEKALQVADRLELDLSRWVGLMSTGMRQKLALSIALANEAPLLILDEPTANLDPTVRGRLIEMICEAKAEGRTVIFSSHVLPEIEDTCDRVAILRSGELVHLESMAELKKQHRIRANVQGELPDVPPDLVGHLEIKREGKTVQIETPGELGRVLHWLASARLSEVYVQPVGLRAIYDHFHHPVSVASQTEVSS